jgi:transcription elongation factor GreA
LGDAAVVVRHQKETEMLETVITPQGLARLSDELERLKTQGRSEIARRLEQAVRREANPLEDPDYIGVLEDQARLERRIAQLTDRLRSAQIVEAQLGNGRIDIGERVRVRDVESGERLDLELVGPFETDISVGRISVASPLGRAMVGRKRGAVVEIDAPVGRRRFEILAVEAPEPRRRRAAG